MPGLRVQGDAKLSRAKQAGLSCPCVCVPVRARMRA